MSTNLATSPVIASKVQMPNTFDKSSLEKLRQVRAGDQTSRPIVGEQYREVFIQAIVRGSPIQVRAPFDPDQDDDDCALVESLTESGQREPVQLVELEGTSPPQYGILDGHRRIAALCHVGSEVVKAIIVRQGTQECDLITLTANVRKNLTPLELARAIQRLQERHHLTIAVIARTTGLSRRYIEKLNTLNGADPEIQTAVEAGQISARTAIQLAKVDETTRAPLTAVAVGHELSETQTQQLIERVSTRGEAPDQAALTLGFASSAPKTSATGAERKPKTLTLDAAAAALSDFYPDLEDDVRSKLASLATKRKTSLLALKMAGLLATTGQPAPEALDVGHVLDRHPHAKKVMIFVGLGVELEGLIKSGQFNSQTIPLLEAAITRLRSLSLSLELP